MRNGYTDEQLDAIEKLMDQLPHLLGMFQSGEDGWEDAISGLYSGRLIGPAFVAAGHRGLAGNARHQPAVPEHQTILRPSSAQRRRQPERQSSRDGQRRST